MGSVTKRECKRGEKCVGYETLARPSPVRSTSKSVFCSACEARHRDAYADTGSPRWLARTAAAIEKVVPGEESPWDFKASLWDLLELDPDNGGHGRKSDRGKVLSSLDPKALRKVGSWLDEHAAEALERDELGRYAELRCIVGIFAWLGALPPHEPLFPEQDDEALPLQVVGIHKNRGRRRDGMKVVQLARLLEAPRHYSERDLENELRIPRSTIRDMIGRLKDIGFPKAKLTAIDLEYVAFGNERGRKRDPESF